MTSFCSEERWMLSLESVLYREGFALLTDAHGSRLALVARPDLALPAGARAWGGPLDSSVDLVDASLGEPTALRFAELICAPATGPWDLLHFPRVRTRSNLLAALPGSGYHYALSDAGASAFCDVSSEDALKAISKDNLRNVDRLKRRAERDLGQVAVESVNDASIATSTFDRFVAVEDAGWKGTQGAGTSLASDIRAQAFFRDVARRFQEDGRARIDFLTIGGRDAAAQLALRAGSTWFLLKIGYHPDFKDVGPGSILLKAFLEEMRDTPDIHEVNLTTNPPWAARWHFQTEPVYHVYIYGKTLRGRLLAAGRSLKELAKRVRDRHQRPAVPETKP
jgi:CelD/BcsL family acetyltransferase involved in cellulose biosynthesis